MGNKKEFNKKVVLGKFVLILIIGIILGISCLFSSNIEKALNIGNKEASRVSIDVIENSKLTLHYIDVGQGDATFIELPDGKTLLIDSGTDEYADQMVNYIKDLEINQIDYFVLTHSDDDHSGGANEIFEAFEVKNIYRPFQIAVDEGVPIAEEELGEFYLENDEDCNAVDTKTYQNYIKDAYKEKYFENGSEKQAQVWVSYDGLKINSTSMEETFLIEFFAPFKISNEAFVLNNTKGYPVETYGKTNRNNVSPIILLEYKEKSFLFTGDAGTTVEGDLIDSLSITERERFTNIDVFQAGHHGADNSNSKAFIELTTPDYVVVSAGKDNSYGHPTDEFLAKISDYNHSIKDYLLRTDLMGNIIIGFDSSDQLAYVSVGHGSGSAIVVYWWHIAVGLFIVLSIIIISVKVTKNKTATAKRVKSKARQVSRLYKKP